MKNIHMFIITAVTGAGLFFSGLSLSMAADNNIISKTIQTADYSSGDDLITDPREAARSFVEHVNYARVALALKNADLARQHIDKALKMAALITNAKVEERKAIEVESGRFVYQYETSHKYYYFPIRTGAVEVKAVSNSAPAWAKPALAVTDAEIVYLTLDLTNNKADKFLNDAIANINAGNIKAADDELSELTEEVVSLDSRASVPLDKARDNIALAYNFIYGQNLNGANFALAHADDALAVMQDSDLYKSHRLEIIAMRQDFKELKNILSKNDASLTTETNAKLSKWWSALNDWAINH